MLICSAVILATFAQKTQKIKKRQLKKEAYLVGRIGLIY
mgnify:CR=1 FL=1